MADNKVDIIFQLLKSGDGANQAAQDIKKVGDSAKDAGLSLEELKKGFEKIVSGLALEEVLRHSVEAFLAFDQAMAKLNGSLHSSGQFTAEYSEELEKMALGFSKLSSFSKSEIIDLMARLTAFGAKKEDLKGLTEATLDLGTVLGRDLASASAVMTAALNGDFSPAMRTLRIRFDESDNATQKYNKTLEAVAKISKGQAKESIATLGGEFALQKKNIEEFNEALGKLALEGLSAVNKNFEQLFSLFQKAPNYQAQIDNAIKLRQALRDDVDAAEKSGTISTDVARRMRGDLMTPGFEKRIMSELHPDLHPSGFDPRTSSGQSPSSSPGGGGDEKHNWEEEAAAMRELQKIQAQIHIEALQGIEAERAKIMERFDEQEKAIYKNSNIAQEEEAVTSARLLESQTARQNQLDLLAQKTQDAQNKHNVQIAEQELILKDQIAAENLRNIDLETANEETRFQQRARHVQNDWDLNDQEYADLMSLEETLHDSKVKHIMLEHDARYQLSLDMEKWGDKAEEQFSSGLGSAIVDAFQSGDKAFQQFAANFLKSMANLILQSLILRSVQGALGTSSNNYTGWLSTLVGGGVGTSSGGSGAISGINLGGAAFTDAYTGVKSFSPGQVPSRAGGSALVHIQLEPGLTASIIQNSIQGATVTVAQHLGQDTPISRAAKRLTA